MTKVVEKFNQRTGITVSTVFYLPPKVTGQRQIRIPISITLRPGKTGVIH